MNYTEKLLKHPEFKRIQEEIAVWEQERIYCRHEMSHALDVCRMAWIMYLETYIQYENRCDRTNDLETVKDRIYVSGLLHDIGRASQYATGEHHSLAGGRIAEQILTDIGYPAKWKEETLKIVTAHHGRDGQAGCAPEKNDQLQAAVTEGKEIKDLAFFIQRADHMSRNCFYCKAADSCKWKQEERNRTILC